MDKKESLKVSILDMASGALKERVACEMDKIVDNIINPNTDDKARELDIKIKIKPSSDRLNAAVSALASSKIRPFTEIPTMLYLTHDGNGEAQVVEAVPQTPGQQSFDGAEQDEPKVIDIHTAQA